MKRVLLLLLLCAAPVFAVDSFVNFGLVTVSTGYDDLATTIVVSSGQGARLPSSGSFNLVWWNATDYGSATSDPQREIIRCTRSTDTLTCTRAAEAVSGTTTPVAYTHNTAGKTYKLDATVTAKTLSTDLGTTGSPQFASLGLGVAASTKVLNVQDGSGNGAIQVVANGGGTGVTSIVNSGQGIAIQGTSVATTVPAILGSSTGYYAGLFYNVTDLGSSALNANNMGVVGQSVYAQAGYFQQGAAVGTGSTLARDNILPGFYVTRVAASLNGHNYTAPILSVEDTTASTGDLVQVLGPSSALKFQITHAGITNVFGTLFAQSTTTFCATCLAFWNTRSVLASGADGKFTVSNNATTNAVTLQTTGLPTCSSNCGTSPSVVGSDTAMIVTMGSTGVPASGFVITFNGTWGAAPSCTGAMALTGMAAAKLPLTLVTSTTTLTVVTNGTAPSTSDKYSFHCLGVQ